MTDSGVKTWKQLSITSGKKSWKRSSKRRITNSCGPSWRRSIWTRRSIPECSISVSLRIDALQQGESGHTRARSLSRPQSSAWIEFFGPKRYQVTAFLGQYLQGTTGWSGNRTSETWQFDSLGEARSFLAEHSPYGARRRSQLPSRKRVGIIDRRCHPSVERAGRTSRLHSLGKCIDSKKSVHRHNQACRDHIAASKPVVFL